MFNKEFKFFRELTSIPIFNSSISCGVNAYHNLKKCHQYMDTTLSTTESLIYFIVRVPAIQKLAQTFETPLYYVDNLATGGLHLIEHKYPSIRMNTEELKEQSKKQMVVLRDAGAKRAEDMLREICRRRRQGFLIAMKYLDKYYGENLSVYIDLIEKSLDQYLPPLEVSGNEVVAYRGKDQQLMDRMVRIHEDVQQRLAQRYHLYLVQFNAFCRDSANEVETRRLAICNDENDGKEIESSKTDPILIDFN